MLRIILALDLLNGIVVHGIKGERHRYRPINEYSKICSSSQPLDLVKALKPKEVYIADLNRIMGTGDNFEAIKAISKQCTTMADVGIRNIEEVSKAKEITHRPVIGTETATLMLIKKAAKERVTISIDIKQGWLLSQDNALSKNPVEAARKISEAGIEELIILNLDRVGTSSGLDLELLRQIKNQVRSKIILGGGVKNEGDLKTLEELGIDGAIVATAIHNGSVPVGRLRY